MRLRIGLRLVLALAAACGGCLIATHAVHASVHHAALVIEHSSGRLLTRCVSFVEDQISGFQLIQRSGVEYQAQQFGSLGEAICQLDGEPSQIPPNCLGYGPYWQYFHRASGGWVQSATGASSWMLHDGDMDGWHYASGAGKTPPNVSFAVVCPPPAAPASVAASHPAAASAAPRIVLSATPATSTPTPTASADLQALAPSASPSQRAVLTATGPTQRPPTSSPIGIWLLLAGATALLVGLGAVNFLRRGP